MSAELRWNSACATLLTELGDEHSAIRAAVRWQELAVDGPKLDSIVLPHINAARSTVQRIFETLNK